MTARPLSDVIPFKGGDCVDQNATIRNRLHLATTFITSEMDSVDNNANA